MLKQRLPVFNDCNHIVYCNLTTIKWCLLQRVLTDSPFKTINECGSTHLKIINLIKKMI